MLLIQTLSFIIWFTIVSKHPTWSFIAAKLRFWGMIVRMKGKVVFVRVQH
jgi:hypothetical protein